MHSGKRDETHASISSQATEAQDAECSRWLYHLTEVWNWAVRKIELNAKDKIYFRKREFQNLQVHQQTFFPLSNPWPSDLGD